MADGKDNLHTSATEFELWLGSVSIVAAEVWALHGEVQAAQRAGTQVDPDRIEKMKARAAFVCSAVQDNFTDSPRGDFRAALSKTTRASWGGDERPFLAAAASARIFEGVRPNARQALLYLGHDMRVRGGSNLFLAIDRAVTLGRSPELCFGSPPAQPAVEFRLATAVSRAAGVPAATLVMGSAREARRAAERHLRVQLDRVRSA